MRLKHLKLYFAIILPLLLGIVLLLWHGKTLQPSSIIAEIKNIHAGGGSVSDTMKHPLPILLLQIIIVLATSKIVGFVFKVFGQQTVIGEMAAGILLGPSLLGWAMPNVFAFLFPPSSLANLQLLSQVGLLLFMFIIGMELDLNILKKRATEALLVSHVSIFFPYLLGVGLAYFLYDTFAPANIPFIAYALFMGITMSITAFPVLARILKERNITQTRIGSMSIICAAIDDVTAWCLLAIVISIAKAGSILGALFTICITVVYVLFMFLVVRKFLRQIGKEYFIDGKLNPTFIAMTLTTLISSAFIAEIIGIHAMFGAFLAGVVMPSNMSLRKIMTEKTEDVSVMLLLPLFFAFTGLRTQIGLLSGPSLWALCGLVIALAISGKFLGSAIAAKVVGQSWRDAISIGTLMNTRGLMELIVLNIGYDLGILTPEIFTIMVFMALATTCMTSPLLNLIEKAWPENAAVKPVGMEAETL
jgi:Kef-type K+ transport system membrane component KefB